MIGIRSAISIRARGHRPHLEAVYMTAPRSACRNTKKLLPRGGRPYMRGALLLLAKHWQALDADERVLERQIAKAARSDREARRLMEVPGVGRISASTVLAKVPDAKVFRTGRDFAAWIGLTGRDHGTGGKHRPGRISKQGDRMLRALMISGASAYLRHQRTRGVSDPWLRELLARRPYKVVMVALAAKTARILWAMLVKGEPYRDRASAAAVAPQLGSSRRARA